MQTTRLTVFASLLSRPNAAPPRRRVRNPAWFDGAPTAAIVEDGEGAGAGWFESSAELRRGLAVLEGTTFDAWQRACDALAVQGAAATTRPTKLPSSITAIA